jgi:tetratricopeptide (TPR) repeat protein
MGDKGIVIGPDSVVHIGRPDGNGDEPLRDKDARSDGVLVVGDVPQEPAAFQPRDGLVGALEQATGSVVFAVTGIRGVGKTQLAAAYARQRIAERWRLVAWVDASSEASVLAGLGQVAAAAGVGDAEEDAQSAAIAVRNWLEVDGAQRLLVFDNAVGLDGLRPFLPAAGAAQVVITSSRRPVLGLGTPVTVDVFTESEALAYLAKRTGLEDVSRAQELARELGCLPLGLAQAAALIAREHLGYGRYLERLRAIPVTRYLERVEGQAYSYRLAEAIMLSLGSVEDADPTGRCAAMMGLVALLAEPGASRRVLHAIAAESIETTSEDEAAMATDTVLGRLVDASLVTFTLDDSVVAHRLTTRVVRERLAVEGRLNVVAVDVIRALTSAAEKVEKTWDDRAWVRELATQITAVHRHSDRDLKDPAIESAVDLLRARGRAFTLLNELGDSTGLAISIGEALLSDQLEALGNDHPDSLTTLNNLAHAYESAGRRDEAISLYEQGLSAFVQVFGDDHPGALISRNNLAGAYLSAGRLDEAISLYEQTVAVSLQVLGNDHPSTQMYRENLYVARAQAARTRGRRKHRKGSLLLNRSLPSEGVIAPEDHRVAGRLGCIGGRPPAEKTQVLGLVLNSPACVRTVVKLRRFERLTFCTPCTSVSSEAVALGSVRQVRPLRESEDVELT